MLAHHTATNSVRLLDNVLSKARLAKAEFVWLMPLYNRALPGCYAVTYLCNNNHNMKEKIIVLYKMFESTHIVHRCIVYPYMFLLFEL